MTRYLAGSSRPSIGNARQTRRARPAACPAAIVEKLRRGDALAYERLVAEHSGDVYALLYRLTRVRPWRRVLVSGSSPTAGGGSAGHIEPAPLHTGRQQHDVAAQLAAVTQGHDARRAIHSQVCNYLWAHNLNFKLLRLRYCTASKIGAASRTSRSCWS